MAVYECPVCGNGCDTPEGCFKHKKRKRLTNKGLKPGINRPKSRILLEEEAIQRQADIDTMWNLFKEIWKERGPYSEISKVYLGPQVKNIFFHHILEKRNYDSLKFEKKNIILLTFQEHSQVEMDKYRYEEINKRREALAEEFNIIL